MSLSAEEKIIIINKIPKTRPNVDAIFQKNNLHTVKRSYTLLIDSIPTYNIRLTPIGEKKEIQKNIHEFQCLEKIKPLVFTPKPIVQFYEKLPTKKYLLTITQFLLGETQNTTDLIIEKSAISLKKVHNLHRYTKPGNQFPPNYNLPYECPLYDEWLNDPEHTLDLTQPKAELVSPLFNSLKLKIKEWFRQLDCFKDCLSFHICYNNCGPSGFLVQENDNVLLHDWQRSVIDIPELDIASYFVYQNLNRKNQTIFLNAYFGKQRNEEIISRINALKRFISFFKILDEYSISKTKQWNAEEMITELKEYERLYF